MCAQVITLILLAAGMTNVVGVETECSSILTDCDNTFNEAAFDDWDALLTFASCVDEVDCPEDTYAMDLKTSMAEDIETKKMNWGREWNVRDAAPHHGLSFAALTIPVLALLISTCL